MIKLLARNKRRRLPWGWVLLIVLSVSGYQYVDKGEVTWLTAVFQGAERESQRFISDPRGTLASIELPNWWPPQGLLPDTVTEGIGNTTGESPGFSAPAWDLSGRTVRVIDGDTIEILDAAQETHRIRLHGIDTPERGQPFGDAARRALADVIAGQGVGIDVRDTDRYGRTIGIVYLGGQNVNLTLVRDGYAWWYERYAPLDDDLQDAQDAARSEGLGLWTESSPIPPWEWRRGRRS